jgi:hypothetical protein
MPHFYFDICEDGVLVPDDTGLKLENLQVARGEAARALTEIARHRVPGSDRLVLVVEIRDEHRKLLCEARLVLEWRGIQLCG